MEELVQCRANLEALQRHGRPAESNQTDESSRSTAFFKDEMNSLKAKIEQAQMKIHDLEQEVLEVSCAAGRHDSRLAV
jgi:DNA mismatch repair ATPase MutS